MEKEDCQLQLRRGEDREKEARRIETGRCKGEARERAGEGRRRTEGKIRCRERGGEGGEEEEGIVIAPKFTNSIDCLMSYNFLF